MKRIPQLLSAGTPHGWLMFGLVEYQDGRQDSLLWYKVCRRSVCCLICGSVKNVRLHGADAKWNWILEHEQFHIAKMDPGKVAAAEALIAMQLPSFAHGMLSSRINDWHCIVRGILRDVFDELPTPQRELAFPEASP